MATIGRRMAVGAMWMVLFKLGERSLGLISTVILARLLVPADFGLIAMAMSIIAFLELMGAFGFDIALIHKQDAERGHYDTAWTFYVLYGLLSGIALVAIAIPISNFYAEPRLEWVVYALALGSVVQGLENIGVVEFRKELEFRKEFNFRLGKKVCQFITAVPLAYMFHSYWALVGGIVVGRLAGVVLSYILHRYRPRFSLTTWRELFHYSKWLLLNNILLFTRLHSADFIIGRMAGAKPLGLFNIAFEISNLPTTELIAPINRAVFPGYAKISSDVNVLRENFSNVIALIFLFALPMAAGIASIAPLIVLVFLGNNWVDATPLIELLALFGAIMAVQTNIGYVLLATGKPKVLAKVNICSAAVLVPSLIFLTNMYGVIGAAWGYLLSACMFLPVTYYLAMRELKIGVVAVVSVVWRPVVATAVMYSVVTRWTGLMSLSTDYAGLLTNMGTSVIVGAGVFIATLMMLWKMAGKPQGAESIVVEKIGPRIMNLVGRNQSDS